MAFLPPIQAVHEASAVRAAEEVESSLSTTPQQLVTKNTFWHLSEAETISPTSQRCQSAPARMSDPVITTLMVHDIPFHLPAQAVADMFDHHGFADTYDWFSMPLSTGGGTSAQSLHTRSVSMGYAFINFKTAQLAAEALELFQNARFYRGQTKMSGTKVARHQGLERNMQVLQMQASKAKKRRGKH